MNIDHKIIDLQTQFKRETEDVVNDMLQDRFPGKNQLATEATILQLGLYQALASFARKEVDTAKKFLDEELNTDVEAGTEVALFDESGLVFKKKRNNDTTNLDAKQLLNELAKLGVDADVIDKAKQASMKPRRGNTYYQVNTYEG